MDNTPQSMQFQPAQTSSITPPSQPQPLQQPQPTPPPTTDAPKRISKGLIIALIIFISCGVLGTIAYFVFFGSLMNRSLDTIQASQADTQRRNDYSNLSIKITEYITNHKGLLPAPGVLDATEYIGATDPSGAAYTITVIDCSSLSSCPGTPELSQGQVYVVTGADCNGTSPSDNYSLALAANSSKRAFAIWGYLFASSPYCQSSY